MPVITLKNIPDSLYHRLMEAAHSHHRGLTKEIVFALESYRQQSSQYDSTRTNKGQYVAVILLQLLKRI